MQKIESGKIVTFSQAMTSQAHGYWGTVERTIRYPEKIPVVFIENFADKQINDTMSIRRTELEEFEYDESLIFSIPVSMLNGVASLHTGMIFAAKFNGRQLQGSIMEISGDQVKIDCNFPEVGVKNLLHEIHIMEIRDQTEGESSRIFEPTIKVI